MGPLQATSTFTLTCLKGRRYARSRVTIFVGASAPYWDEPLDGGFANPFFGNVLPQNGVSPFSFVAGASGRAGRLTDCAVSSPGRCVDGTMFQSSSSYGQIATMRVLCQYDHAGWTPGTGSTCERADGHEQDTWYRFKVRFPSVAYAATPGAQNAVFEFHVDTKTEADAQAHGQAAYSTMIGVQTDGPIASYCTGNPLYCTSPGHNPRLYMQVAGGPLSNGAGDVRRFYPFAPGSLRFDHWYDMVLHIVWSPSPARGLVQWWADSIQAVNTVGPTEYTRYDGSFSYAQSMAMVNYRYWANFPSSIDFDEITIGPSSSSVAAIGFPGWAPAAVHQGA